MAKKIPREESVWRHHFLNAKIGTLIIFFFVLLAFAMFSSAFVFRFGIIPKDYYVTFYAFVVILMSYVYLKKVH